MHAWLQLDAYVIIAWMHFSPAVAWISRIIGGPSVRSSWLLPWWRKCSSACPNFHNICWTSPSGCSPVAGWSARSPSPSKCSGWKSPARGAFQFLLGSIYLKGSGILHEAYCTWSKVDLQFGFAFLEQKLSDHDASLWFLIDGFVIDCLLGLSYFCWVGVELMKARLHFRSLEGSDSP